MEWFKAINCLQFHMNRTRNESDLLGVSFQHLGNYNDD